MEVSEKVRIFAENCSQRDRPPVSAPLIGASIVVSYARRSLTTGSDAESSEGGSPANWQIDEEQERLLEEWAKAKGLWFENSDSIIQKNFGPMIAQGLMRMTTMLTEGQTPCEHECH